jgi:hypothetical protein
MIFEPPTPLDSFRLIPSLLGILLIFLLSASDYIYNHLVWGHLHQAEVTQPWITAFRSPRYL